MPFLIGDFFIFWFVDAPKNIIAYFTSLNNAYLSLFSFRILLRTFFKPWKNEYREGLVGFSIFMGIIIKSIVLFIDILFLGVLLLVELLLLLAFLLWPFATIAIFFIKL